MTTQFFFLEDRQLDLNDDSLQALALATHTTLTLWTVPAHQVAVITARVRTLATLLAACSTPEIRLHLSRDEHVHADVTAPTGVLLHDLPTWRILHDWTHTRYTTSSARTGCAQLDSLHQAQCSPATKRDARWSA